MIYTDLSLAREWQELLEEEIGKYYFLDIMHGLDDLYKDNIVFPAIDEIFTAYNLTLPDRVKVVIVGQDPYHGEGEAFGLSFAVKKGIKIPPSLKNIYKELNNEYGFGIPSHGDLTKWAKQGILLLNSILTVEKDKPGSHKKLGWKKFTDATLQRINEFDRPICFVLWGKEAEKKEKLITNKIHLILKAPHPSPLGAYRGFFGCNHFKKINEFLKEIYNEEIDWNIEED